MIAYYVASVRESGEQTEAAIKDVEWTFIHFVFKKCVLQSSVKVICHFIVDSHVTFCLISLEESYSIVVHRLRSRAEM